MKFIWTKSTLLGGKEDLITWGLGEPCSHFAIEFRDGSVFHSSLHGVELLTNKEFYGTRAKVFEIDYPYSRDMKIKEELNKFRQRKYDWKFFLWLVVVSIKRLVLKVPIPDKIKMHSISGILCTETIDLLPKKYHKDIDLDRATTPYKLYNLLRIKRG